MTNETNEENKELLESVQQALATPVPQESKEVKPYLYQTASVRKKLKGNTFRVGQKSKSDYLPKLDASGEAVKLPNGGAVFVKDTSGIKFWYEGKLISKAEHDELTNGVK